jgi:hypothetical protein
VEYLRPLERINHANLLNRFVSWEPSLLDLSKNNKRLGCILVNNGQVLNFFMQVFPQVARQIIGLKASENERIKLIRRSLRGRLLPTFRGSGRAPQALQIAWAVMYADMVLRYPEAADFLRPAKNKFHFEIMQAILRNKKLTIKRREILSRNPQLCAMLL